MKSHQLDYLSLLPKKYQYKGNHRDGEIEIATDPKTIFEIVKTHSNYLKSLNLSHDSNEIGIVFEDEFIIVIRDPVIFPNGKIGTYLRIIERSSLEGPVGVVMIPFCNGSICLRKVFRHATRQWELECPRGFRSKDLTPTDAVKQEISEELGLNIKSINELGSINANTGLFAGAAMAYWVMVEVGDAHPFPEEEEAFGEIVMLTPKQLMEKIRCGEISDGFTLSAVQLAQAHKLLLLNQG